MGEFNFNNLNLSSLRAGMRIDKDNIFLKKYDKDGNSIFDADELYTLVDDLENFAGDDKKLNKTEALSLFSNVMSISLDKAKEIFNQKGNIVVDSFNTLVEQDAKVDVVEFLKNDNSRAMSIYQSAQGGVISQGWNSIKELFDTEYAGDKVYRQLAVKMVSASLLEKTMDKSVSKKEYIETKIELLKVLLGADKLPKDVRKDIEAKIPFLTVSEVDTLIVRLKNSENEEYPQVIKDVISDIQQKGGVNNDGGGAFKVVNTNSIGYILDSSAAEEPLTFEQVYKMENGVDFDPELINEYEKKAELTQGIMTINNIVANVHNILEEPTKNLENMNRFAGLPKDLYKSLSEGILKVLTDLYGNNPEEINKKLKEYGGPNVVLKDGVIDFGKEILDNTSLVELSKNIQKSLQNELKEALGDKTLDDYNAELKNSYQLAYGAKNSVDLAEKFQQSQAEGVGYAKLAVNTGIALAMTSGGSIIMIGTGMLAGLGTSAGISYVEVSTKKDGITPEDKEAIRQELIEAAKFLPIGMLIGGASSKLGAEFLKRCPTLVKTAEVAEYSSDFLMSLLATYTVTGEWDLSGEGLSAVMNVIQGVIARNKFVKMGVNNKVVGENDLVIVTQDNSNGKTDKSSSKKVGNSSNEDVQSSNIQCSQNTSNTERTTNFTILEKLQEIETTLKEKYTDISDKDLKNIMSIIKDDKLSFIIVNRILGLNSEKNVLNLKTIQEILDFAGKNPKDSVLLNTMLNKLTQTYTQKNVDAGISAIIKFMSDGDGKFIVEEFLKDKDFYWNEVGGICYRLKQSDMPKEVIPTIVKLLKAFPDGEIEAKKYIIKKFDTPEVLGILNKMVEKNSTYSLNDIQIMLIDYYSNKTVDKTLLTMVENAVDNNVPMKLISNIEYYINTNTIDLMIKFSTTFTEYNTHRFSILGLNSIIEALPKPVSQRHIDYVVNLIDNYPNMTTTEIIKCIKGNSVELPIVVKQPFAENGMFVKEYKTITEMNFWKNLPDNTQAELTKYFEDLIAQDPNRFKRLVDSGWFELCEQGKLNVYDLLNNVGTNKFFSKHYLEDVKRLSSGEPLVKDYPAKTDLAQVAKEVPIGETACVGGKMYVNDNGNMLELEISKEMFEKLFPLEGRFSSKQGKKLADCWLVSALDNLMDLPIGRAKLYQLIKQDGDDILVQIPVTKKILENTPTGQVYKEVEGLMEARFPKGEIKLSKDDKQLNGCLGLQLIEQAYSRIRSEEQGVMTPHNIEEIVDVDAQMETLAWGRSEDFIASILNYKVVYPDIYNKNNELVGQSFYVPNDPERAIELVKAFANKQNIFVHMSTKHLPEGAARIEQTLNAPYYIYSNHAYTIKGYDENRGMIYFTNPWDTNKIVEMDIYTFLGYIDEMTFLGVK